ncbi:MAG: hypothetical protein NTY34_00375 [Candidatus Omnitrophica bacterium]|nr:hypothetical protein [Candidatus Omnitrophota bacterium]
MNRNIFKVLLVAAAIIVANAAVAEEIKLTTIIPTRDILRAKKGVVGEDWSSPAATPNASIPASGLIVEGNVGIGTKTPEAKLDVAGDDAAIIVPRKSTTGDFAPAASVNGMIYYNTYDKKFRIYEDGAWKDLGGGGAFGSWTNKDSMGSSLAIGAVYKVTSDGYISVKSGQLYDLQTLIVYSDSTNPPATERYYYWSYLSGSDRNIIITANVPIRNGNYFKVTCSKAVGFFYWLPVGSGQCQKQ